VLGVGASAFDNSAAALEAGAASVDLCFRRAEIPRINPLLWTHFAGMLGHFGELTDLDRWRFMRRLIESPQPPPQDAFWRCRKFKNFNWHANCGWRSVRDDGGRCGGRNRSRQLQIRFPHLCHGHRDGPFGPARTRADRSSDCALGATGSLRRPARKTMNSRGIPTSARRSNSWSASREPFPFLSRLHAFTYGALPSLGLTGAAIPGMKYGVPRPGQWPGAGPLPGGCPPALPGPSRFRCA